MTSRALVAPLLLVVACSGAEPTIEPQPPALTPTGSSSSAPLPSAQPMTDAGFADSGGSGDASKPARPGYMLPLECGKKSTVVQGPGGAFSHNTAQSRDAYDFDLANDTPLVAANDGTVTHVRGDVRPGDPCYSGGGSSCANTVNYVTVAHADGTSTLYLHVNQPLVAVGQTVRRGERIALSGGTGWSTGPHAHVQRQEKCGIWICNSTPLTFVEAGIPKTGTAVTSANCP